MPNLNRVMLMGNLTRDPELRYTPNNTAVCQFTIATSHRWKDANGEQKEDVTFVDCEAWERRAEVINQYLRKGRPFFVEGRLKLDKWQDKEGNNRSKLKVVVEAFEFIDSKPGGGGGDGGGEGGGGGNYNRPQQRGPSAGAQRSQGQAAPAQQSAQSNEPPPMEDEHIPF